MPSPASDSVHLWCDPRDSTVFQRNVSISAPPTDPRGSFLLASPANDLDNLSDTLVPKRCVCLSQRNQQEGFLALFSTWKSAKYTFTCIHFFVASRLKRVFPRVMLHIQAVLLENKSLKTGLISRNLLFFIKMAIKRKKQIERNGSYRIKLVRKLSETS